MKNLFSSLLNPLFWYLKSQHKNYNLLCSFYNVNFFLFYFLFKNIQHYLSMVNIYFLIWDYKTWKISTYLRIIKVPLVNLFSIMQRQKLMILSKITKKWKNQEFPSENAFPSIFFRLTHFPYIVSQQWMNR